MAKKQVYQSRNKALGAIVAVLLAIVMCAAAVLGVGFGVYGKNTDDWFKPKHEDSQGQQGQPEQPEQDQQTQGEARISLFAGAAVQAANGTVSKTLTATVLPADAPDKSVDWSIKWASDAALKDKTLSDYITITPASDGALTATVTCKKSFRGSVAIATVTTRSGGYTASCIIEYEGVPSSMTVADSPHGTISVTGVGDVRAIKKVYGTDGTTKFAIKLDNVFGDVGDSYYNQYVLSGVTSFGQVVLDTMSEGRNGSSFTGKNEKTINLSTIQSQLVDATCDGKNIIITVKKEITSYYESMKASSSGATYSGHYKQVALKDGKAPYFEVTLTNTFLNKSATVKFWFAVDVTSVSLSSTSLTF